MRTAASVDYIENGRVTGEPGHGRGRGAGPLCSMGPAGREYNRECDVRHGATVLATGLLAMATVLIVIAIESAPEATGV
jgi:hypothetical protein